MATWGEFKAEAPELAAEGERLFDTTGLVLVGTLRQDGWPRISPVEPTIVGDRLYLGMMPRSRKALDLQRDPRCVVHSTVCDRENTEGDFKLYGRGREVSDTGERDGFADAVYEKIGWRPEGEFHLFDVDIEQVGYVRVDPKAEKMLTQSWRPGAGPTPLTERGS